MSRVSIIPIGHRPIDDQGPLPILARGFQEEADVWRVWAIGNSGLRIPKRQRSVFENLTGLEMDDSLNFGHQRSDVAR